MKPKIQKHLTVGQVAKRCGVAISTLHFYESKGLIHSWRNAGNQRRYSRDILRRVAVIKTAQRLGIPLQAIGNALKTLPEGRSPSVADWQKLSDNWRQELDIRIQRLMQLRDQLDDCIGCGCLSIKACPLRNPSDQLSEQGSGPQLLNQLN